MTSHIDFNKCYKNLGLSPEADWQQVQSKYRQLLIRWHPDRHRHNKTLHKHATQHFIILTAAFNELRNYHRVHNRLPLQADVAAVNQTNVAAAVAVGIDDVPAAGSPVAGSKREPENAQSENPNTAESISVSKASRVNKESASDGSTTFSKVSSVVAPRTVSGVARAGQSSEPQTTRQTGRRRASTNTPRANSFNLSDEQLKDASLVKVNTRPGLKDRLSHLRSKPSIVTIAAIVSLLVLGMLLVLVLDMTGSKMRQNEANRIVIENGQGVPAEPQPTSQ